MKKNLLLLAVGLFIFGSSFSQFMMTYKSHGILIGDAHDYILTEMIEEGPAGAGQTWDFSGMKQLKEGGNLTSNMLDPIGFEHSSKIPAANTIIEEFGNKFYFNVDNNKIEHFGLVTSNEVVFHYTKPIVKMQYPFTYGDSFTGSFEGKYTTSNNSRDLKGTYNVEADGYGKLILPGNVELSNVMRVKSTRKKEYTSHWVSTVTYRWYVPEVRYPVLVIIKQLTSSTEKTIKAAYYKDAGSIESDPSILAVDEFSGHQDLKVYPNPFENFVHLQYKVEKEAKVNIAIFDESGKKVKTVVDNLNKPAGLHDVTLNAKEDGLVQGTYFVRFAIGNKLYTEKMVSIQ
jgi:hypothetical protein